jgi:hypothetical protein
MTNQPLETGIETDWSTFLSLRPFRLCVRCPHCGERHEMAVRDGYLARSATGAELDGGRPRRNPRIERLLTRLPRD